MSSGLKILELLGTRGLTAVTLFANQYYVVSGLRVVFLYNKWTEILLGPVSNLGRVLSA